jgi:hypothetical protein
VASEIEMMIILFSIRLNSYLKIPDEFIDRSIVAGSQRSQGNMGHLSGVGDAYALNQIPFWYSIDARYIMDGHPGLNSIYITLNSLRASQLKTLYCPYSLHGTEYCHGERQA